MVTTGNDTVSGQTWVLIQANRSMSWRGNAGFLALVSAFGLSVASGFAMQGLWLVFPFVGPEIVALAAGLYWCLRRLEKREVITISPSSVILERGRRGPEQRVWAARAETVVNYRKPRNEFCAGELMLNLQGRAHRSGECLNQEEKGVLADLLRNRIPRWQGLSPQGEGRSASLHDRIS